MHQLSGWKHDMDLQAVSASLSSFHQSLKLYEAFQQCISLMEITCFPTSCLGFQHYAWSDWQMQFMQTLKPMSPFMNFSLSHPLNVQFKEYWKLVMTHAPLSQTWSSQFTTFTRLTYLGSISEALRFKNMFLEIVHCKKGDVNALLQWLRDNMYSCAMPVRKLWENHSNTEGMC